MKLNALKLVLQAGVLLLGINCAWAQRPPRPQPHPHIGRTGALYDITGYWVSVVTEDWRYRMVTPLKGDFTGVPLSPAGRALANAWDPAKDAAADLQCKAYGAPGIMRLPGRLHVVWQDDRTLRVDIDTGTQTRLLHFGDVPKDAGGWQGASQASWELEPGGGYSFFAGGSNTPTDVGSLKVVTTNLKPGYLRKNGVPYSDRAVLTEYFDKVNEPNADSYLIITASVDDPVYLAQPFLTDSHYKKQSGDSGWNPTPCDAN